MVLLRPSSRDKLKPVFPSAATEGGPETKVPHLEPMGWPDVERCLGTTAAACLHCVYIVCVCVVCVVFDDTADAHRPV